MTAATRPVTKTYDLIGFGDEVPGILALVSAAREFNRRTGGWLKILLMLKGNAQEGIGGHLVRGGLAYLDRSMVPPDLRQSLGLPTFGDPASLYQEFLQRCGVNQIALDPRRADAVLRQLLQESRIDILSRVQITSVLKDESQLSAICLPRGEIYRARQFIDSTVNAELAQAAGVEKFQGFGTFGLPDSELPVTLVFETEGLSVQRLRDEEVGLLRRLTNPADTEAQRFIEVATGSNAKLAEQFRRGLVDNRGNLQTMIVGPDYIDVRCRAFSIAYQSFRGKRFSLADSKAVLDQPNIAILPNGRLSWNALLCYTTGSQAEALARGAAKPSAEILAEMKFVEKWLKSIGARVVRPASELYIRHAGNVIGAVEPLSGARMLAGGVPEDEALATFTYHLDVRGGITGLGAKASKLGISSISFHTPPIFNVGIRHALLSKVPNLAVVSPASGFDGYACAAGRIVEFNAAVGQGLGIAASLALTTNRNLAEISNHEVQQVLIQTGQHPRIYGRPNPAESDRLWAFETALGIGSTIA